MQVITGFIFVLLGLCSIMGNPVPDENDVPKGTCECGVFSTNTLTAGDYPLIQQRPFNVTCNEQGQKACTKMCTDLAIAAKPMGSKIICASLAHADALTVSVFTRSCDSPTWIYTGLSCPEPICCHENAPVPCSKEPVNKL